MRSRDLREHPSHNLTSSTLHFRRRHLPLPQSPLAGISACKEDWTAGELPWYPADTAAIAYSRRQLVDLAQPSSLSPSPPRLRPRLSGAVKPREAHPSTTRSRHRSKDRSPIRTPASKWAASCVVLPDLNAFVPLPLPHHYTDRWLEVG